MTINVAVIGAGSWGTTVAALAAANTDTVLWSRRATQIQERSGRRPAIWPVALALMLGLPITAWALLGAPFILEMPVLRGFNFQGGGNFSPEFGALLLGLVIYTASYIAEIVRSGIQ